MSRRSGITLLELVISVAIIGILTAAVTRAFIAGLNYESGISESRTRQEVRDRLDVRLTELFKHAYLSPDDTNTDTFFIGGTAGEDTLTGEFADTIQFTVQGERPRSASLASLDDFETQNQRYGPQGGIAEIAISMTPVGEAGTRQGLFIRTQRPSDSEPTQGGNETVLDESVTSIEFEFWDGTTWLPAWTTQVGAEKRLPSAIRITYTRDGDDAEVPRVLVVRLPISDVTANDPADQLTPGGGA
jgi:prepilin-type N-terminal cleavage/methylation domain-containing protein